MPMMNDLLEKLQDSPPSTEQELMDLLGETGYDLTMKEPAMDEDPMADESVGEEPMEMAEEEMEEAPEDMGPEEGATEMDIIKEMMPMGAMMDTAPEGVNPRMMMQVKTRKAAKKALKEG